jgi:hypothetical protein
LLFFIILDGKKIWLGARNLTPVSV